MPFSDLLVWQKVNHFPEAKQLTRKDLLKKHLVRYQASKFPAWGRLWGKGPSSGRGGTHLVR